MPTQIARIRSMNVQELIGIIKAEKLYNYMIFCISKGRLGADELIAGTYCAYSESEGIYQEEDGTWRKYYEDDRGVIFIASKDGVADEYTEDEACHALLKRMRDTKESAIKRRVPKRHFKVLKPEIWW
jgi:hypothetical protein